MVAQPVSWTIWCAALPVAAILYTGMPSLFWAHTENGSLRLRSNLPLRPPFHVSAARHVRLTIDRGFYQAVGQTVSELRAEFDGALDDPAEPIRVRALSALAHGMQSVDAGQDFDKLDFAKPDCAKPGCAKPGFAKPNFARSGFNVREL